MIRLWRYLAGYLIIKISGENAEQILNCAAKNRISIWNLKCKNGFITGNIAAKDFKKLYIFKHGIKGKIHIVKKCGMVFKTKKHSQRLGIVVGVFLFFAILEIMSNYIWIIEVNGNNTIPNSQIINSCKKIGIKTGINKNKINNKYDAQRLLLIQDGLAWASVNVEGCVLTVNLTETVENKKEEITPSNIKSSIEGKIKKINVSSGNVVVKVGDTVSKGELLVSGVSDNSVSSVFTHSEGEIIANTTRTFSASGNFVQTVNCSSEKFKKHITVDFFDLKIPLYLGTVKNDFDYSYNIKDLKFLGKRIPIRIAVEKYRIINKNTVEYDAVSLEKILYEVIKKEVKNHNFIKAEETNRETITSKEGMVLIIEYNCEENIAVQERILLDTGN